MVVALLCKLEGLQDLPVKINKTKTKKRFFNYLVPIAIGEGKGRKTILNQRKGKGIWQNLWEFPLLESETEIDSEEVQKHATLLFDKGSGFKINNFNETTIVHKLSHQHLYTKFWIVETTDDLLDGIDFSELDKFPVPVLIADFLTTFKNSYF